MSKFKITQKRKWIKIILLGLIALLMAVILANTYIYDDIYDNVNAELEYLKDDSDATLVNTINNDEVKYTSFLNMHKEQIVNNYNKSYSVNEYAPLTYQDMLVNDQYNYKENVIKLNNKETLIAHLNVPAEGLYEIYFDYFIPEVNTSSTEVSLQVNGKTQYYEMKQMIFDVTWLTNTKKFEVDRYGNEILPTCNLDQKWYYTTALSDGSLMNDGALMIYLDKGDNQLSIQMKVGSVELGKITIKSHQEYLSYNNYLEKYQNTKIIDKLYDLSSSSLIEKSNLSVRLYSLQDASSKRYETQHKLLNAIYHDSWNKGHQMLTWEVNVEEAGLYALGIKYEQYGLVDLPVQRSVYVNGEIPYQELNGYKFYYQKNWTNHMLTDGENPYYVYLNKGVNRISLAVSLGIYTVVIDKIDQIMDEMSKMALDIKYLTNGKKDEYRNWKITDYIPNLESKLIEWADDLDEIINYVNEYSHNKKGSSTFATLSIASKKLRKLANDPNQIPNNMNSFTDGSSSVSQLLGTMILTLNANPLGMERLYVGSESTNYPIARSNFFVRLWEGCKRLVISFFNKEYSINVEEEGYLNVWVNRSRQYIEIMQQMADQSGMKVNFSIMPNETKLILANASNKLPDVALGISNWIPYDLALRGITCDLRQFSGYEELMKQFSPGALIPYVYEDGMYGIPETQDFYVIFYRSDIYEMMGLDVPTSWDELLNQLPSLQRLGYNFYSPLSSYRGLKPFIATLPYFYQYGGNLYADDGMTTTLSSEANIEAMKFMTNLFTIYNLPKETLSFYNSFRYGTLPIGIANASTYTQLQIAAPEISGNWNISLYPGTTMDDGTICHYACAGSQGITMFESSKNKKQAWKFIEWWMSSETQSNFITTLYSMYGLEYLWFSANQEACKAIPIPQEHLDIILEQWKWAVEASRVPAAYMLERSISDAYSKVLFNGTNVRIALDDAVIEVNREIERKMTEFNYMKDGVKVKDYIIPTVFNIENWLKEKR